MKLKQQRKKVTPILCLTMVRTLNLQDPNLSPGEFHDHLGSGHKNRFLIYGNTSASAYLSLTVKYQKQKFDVVKSPISITKNSPFKLHVHVAAYLFPILCRVVYGMAQWHRQY
jgi:hypothetical protein